MLAFDNKKELVLQSKEILDSVSKLDSKLYLALKN